MKQEVKKVFMNQWLVVYVDENGDRQIMPFDFYEQAVDYANKLKEHFVPINGVMTARFYDHYVEKIIEE